ncbi:MAG: hypothetical protein C0425_02745 [Chlorobiaceae bacterium]|nr:hypothetical protein [Chlorobiaceae bacterium]MBA4309239.1 hypothetical protein [Chlorobiaceae bacterium]
MSLRFFVILLFFSATTILSQDEKEKNKVYHLSEVVISATRTATPLLEIGSSITVIDRDEIEKSNKNTLYELLTDVPGIYLAQYGGTGKLTYLYMRGANSNHTLVFIDGIEMNNPGDPSNTFDFSNLLTDEIETVEILRGPQSTLYGSDAMAGVINIITKKISDAKKYSLMAEGGTYNTFKFDLATSGRVENFGYLINLNQFKTDGFPAASKKYFNTMNNGSENNLARLNLTYDFSPLTKISFQGRFTDGYAALPQSGGLNGEDPNYNYDLQETMLSGKVDFSNPEKNLNTIFTLSYLRNFRKYSDEVDFLRPTISSKARYDGYKVKYELMNTVKINESNRIILGAEREEESAVSDYFYDDGLFPFMSSFPRNSISNWGIYLQNQVEIDKSMFVNVGGRLDLNQKFGSYFTYRIAPTYFYWVTRTKLKGSLGTGFKSPSLFYLFDPVYGNQSLQPEKNVGWDVGFEQLLFDDKIILDITYFANNFKDLFGFDNRFKATNISKAESKGVEANLLMNISDKLNFKLSHTRVDAIDKNENSVDYNEQLLRRPKNKSSISFNYKFLDAANLFAETIFVGERGDKDFSKFPAERVTLKKYTLVNLSLSYEILEYLEIYGRIHNLLNEEYEEVLGYGTAEFSSYFGFRVNL